MNPTRTDLTLVEVLGSRLDRTQLIRINGRVVP